MDYKKIEIPYVPEHRRWSSNPFTMAFCRTRDQGNILITGCLKDVDEKIEKIGPALVSYRFWFKGKTRGYIHLVNCPRYIVHRDYNFSRLTKKREKLILVDRDNPGKPMATWRRCPSTFPRILVERI